jgi:hypothetical protein
VQSRRSPVLRAFVIGGLTLFGGIVLYYAWVFVPYFKAATEYDRLSAHRPKTRAEVDRVLRSWPHRRIDKSESQYGRLTELTGNYEQYSVLGAPIDLVYDPSDRVIAILPSYE